MKTDTHGLCRTCRGTGNILSSGYPLEWFACPACKGNGARFQFGPAILSEDTTHD